MTSQPPYLSDDEIAEICKPLKMPAAQRRHLMRMGLLVKSKANGQPIVARAEFDRVMTGVAPTAAAMGDPGPSPGLNIIGLETWAKRRKARCGKNS